MPFVFSTSTGPLDFVEYDIPANPRQVAKVIRRVSIKGGANLPKKSLEVPAAVVTEVSNEDLAFLMNNEHFQRAIKRGFIRVESHDFKPEVVANDMTPKDGRAPKTPDDFITGEQDGADLRAIKVG